jgi:competence protein ComEC
MDSIRIAFLRVGHGDSAVLTFPNGETAAIIDTPKARVTLEYLKQNNIKTLKWVFLSHTHFDHANGVVSLIKEFHKQGGMIETLYINRETIKLSSNDKGSQYTDILFRDIITLRDQGILKNRIEQASTSTVINNNVDNILFKILHPEYEDLFKVTNCPTRKNDVSAVIQFVYNGKSTLFTGDLSSSGWQWLKARGSDIQSNILKYPHHAGWFDNIPEFVQTVRPQYTILSYDEQSISKYKQPIQKVTQYLEGMGIKVISTMDSHVELIVAEEIVRLT